MKKALQILVAVLLLASVIPNMDIWGASVNQTFVPDALSGMVNLTGGVASIQEDIDAPDANWLTAPDPAVSMEVSGTFGNPPSNLVTGADLQKFRLNVRKTSSAGSNPTVGFFIYERRNGSLTQVASKSVLVPDAGVKVEILLDASVLTDRTGASVEFKVTGTNGTGGPSTKRMVEVGTLNWDATIEQLVPSAPANFAYTDRTASSINLSWDAASQATSYELRRDSQVIYSGTGLSYADNGLAKTTNYSYQLVAKNSYGSSTQSTLSVSTNSNEPPAAVTNLAATKIEVNSVSLSWDASMYANSYKVYRGSLLIYEGKLRSFQDSNLQDNAPYSYSVVAVNGYGESASSVINVQTKPNIIINGGGAYSVYLDKNNRLWLWGSNLHGQMADGTNVDRKNPYHMSAMTDIRYIHPGLSHMLLTKKDSTLWVWGNNSDGELGIGNITSQNLPLQMKGPDGVGFMTDVKKAEGGYNHSVILKNDGTVWTVGQNTRGQLGNGNTTSSTFPVQVRNSDNTGFLTGVKDVVVGMDHTIALMNDGRVLAWGDNANTQLANGLNSGMSTLPTPSLQTGGVPLSSIVNIYTERYTTFAVDAAQKIFAWGYNGNGQIGDNGVAYRSSGTVVTHPHTMFAAGGLHTLRLQSDDTVWAWGWNLYGQVGDGTMGTASENKMLPVQVKGKNGVGFLSNVNLLMRGDVTSYALLKDGSFLSWGANSAGQLGNGTLQDSPYPIQVLFGPHVPVNVKATVQSSTSVKLDWEAVENATSYEVKRNDVVVYTGTLATFSESGLVSGQTYQYKVAAVNSYGKSKEATLQVVMQFDATPPGNVTGITETHTENAVTLSWTNPADSDFSHVNLYRNGTLIAQNIAANTYADSGLASNTLYQYRIVSVDKTGNAASGTEISVTTNAPVQTGSLQIGMVDTFVDFGELTVNGEIQMTNSFLGEMEVRDTRSTNDGWQVSVQSSPFSQVNQLGGQTPKTLPVNSLQLNVIQSVTQTAGSSALPVIVENVPVVIDNGVVSILRANSGGGIGTFKVVFPAQSLFLSIDTSGSVIDQSVGITTYESQITWMISAGP